MYDEETTPLYHACASGGSTVFDMVRMLLEMGARVTDCGASWRDVEVPLGAACAAGNFELLKFLLSCHSEDTMTSYRVWEIEGIQKHACDRGNLDCYELIFETFPTDFSDEVLATELLAYACSSKNLDMVKKILARGGSVQSEECFGRTPLAAAWEVGNTEMLQLLFEAGANPNGGTKSQPLLCGPRWPKLGEEDQVACLKLVLALGADPHATDGEGICPLHVACSLGAIGCVKLLLEEHNADATRQTKAGTTPLHLAVRAGELEIVKMLIAKGADVNSGRDRSPQFTSIHGAFLLDEPTGMIEYSLAQNADPTVVSFSSWYTDDPLRVNYYSEIAPRPPEVGETALCMLAKHRHLKQPARAMELLLA